MTDGAVNPATSGIPTARSSDILQIHLVDEEGQNILSIDDGAKRQSLRVEIVNTSGQAITLKDLNGNFSTNYHFCISFRPGTLVDQGTGVTLTVQDGQGNEITGWQIQQAKDTFFLRLDMSASAKTIATGQRITLVLGNIGAAPAGGSRGTRVEIRFSNLQHTDTSQAILSQTRLLYLNIVNQRGKKQIPLYAGFLGSNTILNDNSENELTLSIQSLPRQSLPLRIEPYSSDKFKDVQSVTSDQTSFSQTVFDLLQKLPNFQNFLTETMNAAIDTGMPDNTPLSRIHGDQNIIRGFTNQTSQIIQGIRQTIKQSIERIVKSGDINKFLDGQKTVKDLVWRDNQQSFLDAIFSSSPALIDLFNGLRLDRSYALDLIPDNVANLKPYQVIREANNPTRKSAISDALVKGFELINPDDLRVILAGLNKLNFKPTETALNDLSLIGFDDAKSVETSVLGFKGINSGSTINREAANAALDESVTIRISFDVATTADDSKHWALVEKNNADDIQIAIAKGQETWIFGGKLEQGITPQWSFVCKQPLQLTDRQEILRLSIKNLKTQLLSGYANLYVHYENFPGYWDGFITVPVHKGPLVYRECEDANKVKTGCVGIGTDKPQAKLHVKSSAGLVGLKVDGDAEITGNFSAGKLSMGELGIGTTDLGDNKLKVQGNTAIVGKLTVTDNLSVGQMIEGTATQSEYGTKLYFRGATENTDPIWMSRYNTGSDQSYLKICLGDDGINGGGLDVGYVNYVDNKWVQTFLARVDGNVEIAGSISTGGKVRIRNTDRNKYIILGRSDGVESSADLTDNGQFRLEMVCSRILKENISSLSDDEAIQTLLDLRSVKYDYKGEKAFRQILGFIAEEMPDNLASQDRQSISPFEVIPVLTKVIQLQQESIRQLQEKVDMVWLPTDKQKKES